MDYKDIYLSYYSPAFLEQESWIKCKLLELKKKNNTFQKASNIIDDLIRNKFAYLNLNFVRDDNHLFIITLNSKNELYVGENEENLQSVLNEEILGLYKTHNKGEFYSSYEEFLKDLGKYKGLIDAKNFYKIILPLVEVFYKENRLDKFKLEEVETYEDHSAYNLFKDHFEKEKKESKKSIKIEFLNDSPLPVLDNEEKLLLIHYLLSAKSLDDIDKIKILALLDTSPIDISIFKEKSRENRQYNLINKGYNYFGKKTGLKLLFSLYDQIQSLKINNLNRVIKMDLNKLKQ